jgi:hypothetical protein
MAKVNFGSPAEVVAAVGAFLDAFPGSLINARQIWYEGFGGQGIAKAPEVAAIEAALDGVLGGAPAGDVRYEKSGEQKSWKRSGQFGKKPERIMVQHMFKLNGKYKTPDGKILKVVLSEVYNLRCFEVDAKGNLTGGMIKIHPESELAGKLVPVD